MYLEKLEIFGFKSFAQKTVFEFPRPKDKKFFSVTAIVGPNGCGKSNIVDAIRWGLGEQSLKLLRGKKSEDVIFFGSNKKVKLNFAEVSLYFNNEDKKADIDWSHFVITRRIYRSGESEYLINRARVRLQDILILLAKTNFGQKSFSIIGQGMIDSIIHSTTTERKNFFDEATGVKHYQIKKDEALRKIEKTKENLKQAEIALNELEPRMRSLTRQIKKLERRQEIEEKLRDLEKKYYSSLWNKLTREETRLKDSLEKFIKEKESKEMDLKNIQRKMEEIINEESDKQYETIQNRYQELLELKNKYLEESMEIKMRINTEKQKKPETKKTEKFNLTISDILKRLKEISKSQHLFLETFKKSNNLEDLKMQIQKITEQIDNLIKDILPEKEKEQKYEEQNVIDLLEKKNKNILMAIEEINKNINETIIKLKNFSGQEKEKRQRIYDLQKVLRLKQNDLNQINNKINDIKVDLAKLETKKESLRHEIENEKIDIDNKLFIDNVDSLLPDIQKLKRQIELIGGIDPEVTKEYPECRKRWEFLSNQTKDLNTALQSLEKINKELDQKITEQFNQSFSEINRNFEKYFKIFFNGGRAKLLLKKDKSNIEDKEETEQKQQTTIEILATPPGKRIKHLEALSGGEKALTSLSLICAIIATSKPPFVVFDEVDSALDEENSLRFANIVKELSKQTQFIIITHNRQVMHASDILYGITMDSLTGVSKVVSLKMEK